MSENWRGGEIWMEKYAETFPTLILYLSPDRRVAPPQQARTRTESRAHEQGCQRTPTPRITPSLSQLICDIGPELSAKKTNTSDRPPELECKGPHLNRETMNTGRRDGVKAGSDGNGS